MTEKFNQNINKPVEVEGYENIKFEKPINNTELSQSLIDSGLFSNKKEKLVFLLDNTEFYYDKNPTDGDKKVYTHGHIFESKPIGDGLYELVYKDDERGIDNHVNIEAKAVYDSNNDVFYSPELNYSTEETVDKKVFDKSLESCNIILDTLNNTDNTVQYSRLTYYSGGVASELVKLNIEEGYELERIRHHGVDSSNIQRFQEIINDLSIEEKIQDGLAEQKIKFILDEYRRSNSATKYINENGIEACTKILVSNKDDIRKLQDYRKRLKNYYEKGFTPEDKVMLNNEIRNLTKNNNYSEYLFIKRSFENDINNLFHNSPEVLELIESSDKATSYVKKNLQEYTDLYKDLFEIIDSIQDNTSIEVRKILYSDAELYEAQNESVFGYLNEITNKINETRMELLFNEDNKPIGILKELQDYPDMLKKNLYELKQNENNVFDSNEASNIIDIEELNNATNYEFRELVYENRDNLNFIQELSNKIQLQFFSENQLFSILNETATLKADNETIVELKKILAENTDKEILLESTYSTPDPYIVNYLLDNNNIFDSDDIEEIVSTIKFDRRKYNTDDVDALFKTISALPQEMLNSEIIDLLKNKYYTELSDNPNIPRKWLLNP